MKKKPLISVVIPVYKAADFISLTLQSICEQSFEQLEIILVNDSTPDNSIEIATETISRYKRSMQILNKPNGGPSAARNAGLKAANSEYICFIDSDDVIDRNHLLNLYNILTENSLNICFADYEQTTLKNRKGSPCNQPQAEILTKDQLIHQYMTRQLKIQNCAFLYKKAWLIQNNLLFNEELSLGEDADLFWRIAATIDRIGHNKQMSYKYLYRKNSLMTNQSIDNNLVLFESQKKILPTLNLGNFDYRQILYRGVFGKLHIVAKSSKYNKFKQFLSKLDMRAMKEGLANYPDLKLRIGTWVLYHIPFLFFCLTKLT